MTNQILTAKEAAALLGISKPTFISSLRTKKIKGRKIHGNWFTTEKCLIDTIEAGGEEIKAG